MQQNSMLLTAIIGFCAGIVIGTIIGYIIHDLFRKTLKMDENMIRVFIVLLVATAWFISVMISWLNPTQDVPLQVHLLMGGIVGSLGLSKVIKLGK